MSDSQPFPIRDRRSQLLGQSGGTVWLTGLSGSGKTTVARALETALAEAGVAAYRLDGDEVRRTLSADLGFSPEDRAENIRRIGAVARLMADAGVIVLVSFISPYASGRDAAREAHEAAGLTFLEVFVDCPLAVAEERDPKGLYRRARAGEIPLFTGISAPYERPLTPDVHLHTDELSVDEEVARLMAAMRDAGLIGQGVRISCLDPAP